MEFKKKIFHGGCHGCEQQEKRGIDYCVGCMHYRDENTNIDWDLPDKSHPFYQLKSRFYTLVGLIWITSIVLFFLGFLGGFLIATSSLLLLSNFDLNFKRDNPEITFMLTSLSFILLITNLFL